MLHVNALTYRLGARILFDSATVHVAAGQRVGLVGRNGAGKSTLFRLIAGELGPDGGSIALRPRARLGCLAQDMPDSEDTLLAYVLAHDAERHTLLTQLDRAHAGQADIHDRLTAIDAHAAPARAAAILAGLGFDEAAQARPVNSYSGGWRMRVALAGTLFAKPDLLLLDEPTNHLDLEACLWLEDHLAGYDGTLIVISHDRDLLNRVAERIVHIDQGRLVSYGGNYDRFEQTRRERLGNLVKAAAKQAEDRARLQTFIDRFRAKANKAAQAQSRIKMLERLGPPIAVVEETTISFDFPDPEPQPPPLIAIERGKAGYVPGKPVLRGIELRIDQDDRIALLGANGNGKSTLAKIMAGRLALQDGTLFRPPKLRIGYFSQDQADELNLAAPAYAHMQALMPDATPTRVRAQLGRFGFSGDRADVAVGNLSGGEKARLLFALMSRDAPHLMILDEPTNHLDIDSREALVEALNAYSGAVVLISHDSRLIELAADRLWLVADGRVGAFDGDMADYRALLLARQPKPAEREVKRNDDRKIAAERRARRNALQKAVNEAERTVERLHRDKAALEARLADPALYANGMAAQMSELHKTLSEIARSLESAEETWLSAHQALDDADASVG
jgi:ATP-binding cassette subfamily F protein 3